MVVLSGNRKEVGINTLEVLTPILVVFARGLKRAHLKISLISRNRSAYVPGKISLE